MRPALLFALIALALVLVALHQSVNLRPVPACAEDAAIVGTGVFQDGRWSAYACGPSLDDLAPRPRPRGRSVST